MKRDALPATAATESAITRPLGAPVHSQGGWRLVESLYMRSLVAAGHVPQAVEFLRRYPQPVAAAILAGSGIGQQSRAPEASRPAGPARVSAPAPEVASSEQGASALASIQAILAAPEVEIGLAGNRPLAERPAMLYFAGQAVKRSIAGFDADGIGGKYKLPASIVPRDLKTLYGQAAGAMAVDEVRRALPAWAQGNPTRPSQFVPDTIVRVLRGRPTLPGAKMVSDALNAQTIFNHGSKQGLYVIQQALAKTGVDLDRPTAVQAAEAENLKVVEPDRQRGRYMGRVVGVDHKFAAVKWSRDSVILVKHTDLPKGHAKPHVGDSMSVRFAAGQLHVVTQPRVHGNAMGNGGR